MSKGDRYSSSKPDSDELDTISEKLAADLRRSIRHLDNYPILSDPWFEMAEIFGRVAHISDVESNLPSSKKGDATLWETEEQALRFLLEDGKLNLCLRILVDFKQRQSDARRNQRGAMIDFVVECDKFEKGIGVILKNAWSHVEVIQTTDIPALVNHIADVLDASLSMSETVSQLAKSSDIHQRQELLVFYYLFALMKNLEEIREGRVMPIVRERRIFTQAVKMMNLLGHDVLKVHRLKAAQALALLVDTEDFITHTGDYYTAADVPSMVSFKEHILQELMSDFDNRKLIRPLGDAIDKAKRRMRK